MVLPNRKKGEIFGVAEQLLGGSRLIVMCEDGKSRLGRIPGRMKRRMWIKTGDLLILKPWSFQDEKANIVYRYTKTQAVNLAKKRKLPDLLDIF